MAVNNLWLVKYHFENSQKKAAWGGQATALVIAANGNEATIKNVLTSNGIAAPGATVALDHVSLQSSNVLS